MTEKKVWLVTGAGRGLGVDIAKAALAAGHAVVATARNADSITKALGEHDDLLAVALDVTDPAAADAAVRAAVERFGHLDVLVNNAGSFQAGFFEEMTPEAFRSQIETTLFGPVNVTRAALPQLRAQRSGLVMTISSTAGIAAAGDFLTAYAASKFGVEGFMEGLAPEVAPFGIRTMLVEPGFFRTELLTPQSTQYAEPSIEDYADRTTRPSRRGRAWTASRAATPPSSPPLSSSSPHSRNPRRGSPPAPTPSSCSRPRPSTLLAQADAHRALSSSLAPRRRLRPPSPRTTHDHHNRTCFATPDSRCQHPPGEVRQVLAHRLRVRIQRSEPAVPFVPRQCPRHIAPAAKDAGDLPGRVVLHRFVPDRESDNAGDRAEL